MALAKRSLPEASLETAIAVLHELFGNTYACGFAIRLWDGTLVPAVGPQRFTLCINHPGALRSALTPPVDLGVGRAFVAGLLSVEGDLEVAVDTLMRASSSMNLFRTVNLIRLVRHLPEAHLPPLREAKLHGGKHTRMRDRAAISFHYDQPVAFYRTFLDRELMYSCAYFDDGVETLDQAQIAKIDHTLRKLRLQPGERLLDIGCGWGAVVARAAAIFGARATGITLSREQYEEGRRRLHAAGLEGSAQVQLRDYRELGNETFDKIVSIGMFEHVGRGKLPEYFRTAFEALRPGGLFLNHGIANQHRHVKNGKARGFMAHFIFPDGELVRISEALGVAESAGFEVRDVENLREHYTSTLRAWVANLERNRDAAVAAAGEHAVRAWRLYMAGSAQGFRTGRLGLFQTLLARPRSEGSVALPMTRRDLYAHGA
jgi:cyclopropane-fatty-acyl-phospholipid synthase